MQKTIFIDRDGVVNRRLIGDWVKCWSEFDLLPNVPEALALLKQHGYRLILITNQRALALKLFTAEELDEVHRQMNELIESKGGASFDAIYICPHDRHDNCNCRKPKPGMFFQAKKDFPDIEFSQCSMIGDSDSDGEAAISAGCSRFYKVDETNSLFDCTRQFIANNC